MQYFYSLECEKYTPDGFSVILTKFGGKSQLSYISG